MADIKKIFEDKVKFSYLLAGAALCFFAFFLLVKIDLGSISGFNRGTAETRNNLELLKKTVDFKDYINRFDSQFTESRGVNWLMETLTSFSKDEDITLGTIKPTEVHTVAGYRIIRITADGSAAYPSLLRLIQNLEKNKKHIIIEQLTITVREGPSTGMRPTFTTPGIMRTLQQGPQQGPGQESNIRMAKFTLNIASISAGI